MAARTPGIAPPPNIDETAPPQRSPLRGVLPFGPPPPPIPAPPGGRPGAPRGAPPPPAQQDLSGEETAPPARSPLAAALPFRHAKTTPATMAIPAPTPEDLRRLTGGTPGGMPPPASPPEHGQSTSSSHLTLEHYAALCAEVAVFPQAAEATFARYGLASRKDRMAADLGWQARLRQDPALMAKWQGLYLSYHEHHSRRAAP